jgi:hypothetical protein
MELLGDWVMRNLASICLETVLCWCKIGASFAPNIPYAQKSFWMHPMVFLGHGAQVEAHFSLFGDSTYLHAK